MSMLSNIYKLMVHFYKQILQSHWKILRKNQLWKT